MGQNTSDCGANCICIMITFCISFHVFEGSVIQCSLKIELTILSSPFISWILYSGSAYLSTWNSSNCEHNDWKSQTLWVWTRCLVLLHSNREWCNNLTCDGHGQGDYMVGPCFASETEVARRTVSQLNNANFGCPANEDLVIVKATLSYINTRISVVQFAHW